MSWEEIKIGSICKIKHGYAFKGEFFSNEGEYILLSPGNFFESGGLKSKGEKEKYYVGDFPSDYILNEEDLLVVMTDLIQNAPILGGCAIVPEDNKFLHNQRLGKITNLDENKIDKKFLYYCLNEENYRGQIRGSATGATVRHTAPERIYNAKINIPTSLETQKRIASILSTYDDLIENNLKRIKLLEETAQNIYKEWFVNFRFPNYEHTEFDAESGLPKGWRKGKVADLCEVKSGYAFKSKDWQTEGNPVMKIKNITNNTVDITDCDYVDDEVAQSAEKFELFEGDVLIAMTGATVGKVGLIPKIDKRIYINQRVGLFRPFSEIENNVYLVFSFFMTDDAQKQILNFAGGAAQPNISSSQISDVELNIGSDEILKMFESKIQSIMVQIQTLYSQNQKLKEARDILLLRLMNRMIEV